MVLWKILEDYMLCLKKLKNEFSDGLGGENQEWIIRVLLRTLVIRRYHDLVGPDACASARIKYEIMQMIKAAGGWEKAKRTERL